jgi:hypothetical protein
MRMNICDFAAAVSRSKHPTPAPSVPWRLRECECWLERGWSAMTLVMTLLQSCDSSDAPATSSTFIVRTASASIHKFMHRSRAGRASTEI